MSDIFISHVEEDGSEVIQLASRLEEAGYSTWYYERNAKPGLSYLRQVAEAIGQSQVLLLILSKISVTSHQVDKELIHAFEKNKYLIPVLTDVTFPELEQLKPDWKLALGASVAEPLLSSDIDQHVDRLILALEKMGVQATQDPAAPRDHSEVFVRIRLGPEALMANELLPLFQTGYLKCFYRILFEGEARRWSPATIVLLPAGLFVNLREVPEEALVQLKVAHDSRTWESKFFAANIVNVSLEDAG